MPQLSPIFWGMFPVVMTGLMLLSFSFVGEESNWDASGLMKGEMSMIKSW